MDASLETQHQQPRAPKVTFKKLKKKFFLNSLENDAQEDKEYYALILLELL